MTNPEDDEDYESDADAAGMEELRRMLEPLYEKARQSKHGLLNFGGGSYAVIMRTHCSSTKKDSRRWRESDDLLENSVAIAEFQVMTGYERVDFSTAIKQLLKLRNEEEAQAGS